MVVPEKNTAFANSDAVLPGAARCRLGRTYRLENFTLPMDVGTFEFKSGTITFLAVVNRYETGAIFMGQGHFTLKPFDEINKREMVRRTGHPTAEEDFSEVVFRFTGNQYPRVHRGAGRESGNAAGSGRPRFSTGRKKCATGTKFREGFTQAILEGETIDNVDADVLAAIYNPKHPAFFNAYMHGTPHKDLRFFIRDTGGRDSADGFSGGSGADQLQWRGDGRRGVVSAAFADGTEGAYGEFARGQAPVCRAPLQH